MTLIPSELNDAVSRTAREGDLEPLHTMLRALRSRCRCLSRGCRRRLVHRSRSHCLAVLRGARVHLFRGQSRPRSVIAATGETEVLSR